MKKILTILLAACMVFSFTCTSAFATDGIQISEESATGTPRAGNLLVMSPTLFSGHLYRSVTPAKGETLKIAVSLTGSSSCTLKVTKNGGWWASTTITIPCDGTTHQYVLIENCNGEPYELNFYQPVEGTLTAIVYSSP